MSEAPTPPESIPQKWDSKLERYGILEGLADYMKDYGITLRVGTDERGRECMLVDMENVHMTEGELLPPEEWISLRVAADEGAGTVRMEIPLRYVLARFAVAFTSYQIKNNPTTGEQEIEEGPKSAHSGFFSFVIYPIDDPRAENIKKYSFRTDYTDEDIERRRSRRGK